jgi:hypothetical protein
VKEWSTVVLSFKLHPGTRICQAALGGLGAGIIYAYIIMLMNATCDDDEQEVVSLSRRTTGREENTTIHTHYYVLVSSEICPVASRNSKFKTSREVETRACGRHVVCNFIFNDSQMTEITVKILLSIKVQFHAKKEQWIYSFDRNTTPPTRTNVDG